MSAQSSFEFAAEVAPHALEPAGSWAPPRFTLADLMDLLGCASDGLPSIPQPLASVFSKLVAQGVAELAAWRERCAWVPGEPACLPRVSFQPSEAEAQAVRQAVAAELLTALRQSV